jgi:hypothetical protein
MKDSIPLKGGSALHIVLQATLWTFAWTGTASALPCLEDKFGSNVNCTANDIRITDVSDIVITDDGCATLDDTVTFNATLTVVTTATSRYDIGLFIGEDGVQAQNGECSVFALPTSPTPPYSNLDSDSCGDSQAAATIDVPVTGVTVSCNDTNGDNELDLATCTSWRQNTTGVCGGAADVTAGTASKCNCPSTPTDIPIFVPDPVCVTNADCEALATGCQVGICDVANPDAGAFGCTFTPTDSLCADDLFCNGAETCNDEGACVDGTAPDCDDDIACTNDSCDEAGNQCTNSVDDSVCNDDLFCNGDETCNAETGCVAGTSPNCGDAFACTTDSCNEATDSCVNNPNASACSDGLFCNGAESCSAEVGCQAGTAPSCADAVTCTADTCNEATDSCDNAPNNGACSDGQFCNGTEVCDAEDGCVAGSAPDCDDEVSCTDDSCNETTDSCVSTPDNGECDDGLFCNGEERCDLAGGCTAGTSLACDDGLACTLDACSEVEQGCITTGNDLVCDDQNDCTADICEPTTGCEYESLCESGICRSPGFWSTHGGFEKNGPNITQAVLDAVDGIEVCGQTITATSNTSSPWLDGLGLDSALEGLCVKTEGERQRSLYRQLLAAALNCAISGSEDCDTLIGGHTDVSFDECNSLCAGEDVGDDGPTIRDCIGELDCYNNGGEIIEGDCALGNCSVSGELCGDDSGECPDIDAVPQDCEAFPGNCHDAEFCQEDIDVCPDRVGPASSSKACKEARSNDCTIDSCD